MTNQYGFLALALRQRLIKRWSLMHTAQTESVLEHAASVTLLAFLAGTIAQQNGKPIDLGKLLSHAILHDTAEVLCSDIVTPIKKANKVLEAQFRLLEDAAEEKLVSTLPEQLKPAVQAAFAPGGIEQELVKACDTYAAYIKCKLEIAAGNRSEFESAHAQLQVAVNTLITRFPEIESLDMYFSETFDKSVDTLLGALPLDN